MASADQAVGELSKTLSDFNIMNYVSGIRYDTCMYIFKNIFN